MSKHIKTKSEWKRKIKDIISVVEGTGEILLKSGAEIFRVEDTVKRMLEAIPDTSEVYVYVVPSAITISLNLGEIPYSYTYTVKGSRINLNKIDKANQFARDFVKEKSTNYKKAKEKLKAIDDETVYKEPTRIFCASFACFLYVWLINGGFVEGIVAFFSGLCSVILCRQMQKRYVNFFLVDFLGAMICATLVHAVKFFIPNLSEGAAISGSIMPLVPGIALTNSVRDSMAGNFITGASRLIEVMLAAIAIALGVFTAYSFFVGGFFL